MACTVTTPVFEGPFDLLLHLILQEQVDLYEIPLARVVDAYLAEVERMESLDLEVATEFLMIAATLVELKAKRLLPVDASVDLDEEFALWEERDLLLARLLDCKTFKDAARALQALAVQAGRSWPRTAGLEESFFGLAPDPFEGVDADDLRAAFVRAITPRPVPTVDLSHLHQIRITVADAMVELLDELPRVGRTSFRELTAGFVDRIEVVVRFLAVLELFKQGLIDIDQPTVFGEIHLLWLGGEGSGAASLADLDLVDDYAG